MDRKDFIKPEEGEKTRLAHKLRGEAKKPEDAIPKTLNDYNMFLQKEFWKSIRENDPNTPRYAWVESGDNLLFREWFLELKNGERFMEHAKDDFDNIQSHIRTAFAEFREFTQSLTEEKRKEIIDKYGGVVIIH